MRNEENDCIRYLMKEMDPSEELLMERAMMEDEDLLIEVESMRQTLQKLDKLPQVEPPLHVSESILEKATEHAKQKKIKASSFKPVFKYAVAATLALTITAGGTWFFVGSDKEAQQQQQQPPSVASTLTQKPEASAPAQFSSSDIQKASVLSDESGVTPWVDRNDIIRFEDQFSTQNSQFEALLRSSTKKLQLIENPTITNDRVNSIQLTGSNN